MLVSQVLGIFVHLCWVVKCRVLLASIFIFSFKKIQILAQSDKGGRKNDCARGGATILFVGDAVLNGFAGGGPTVALLRLAVKQGRCSVVFTSEYRTSSLTHLAQPSFRSKIKHSKVKRKKCKACIRRGLMKCACPCSAHGCERPRTMRCVSLLAFKNLMHDNVFTIICSATFVGAWTSS